jgi:hypothetical protein
MTSIAEWANRYGESYFSGFDSPRERLAMAEIERLRMAETQTPNVIVELLWKALVDYLVANPKVLETVIAQAVQLLLAWLAAQERARLEAKL